MTTPFQVVLPQLIVEVALPPASPVSGAGTMTLDSVTSGVLGTDFLATADAWTDITADVLGFTITRSSSRVQGPLLQYQAGTASITLDNSAGKYDPDNAAGPYAGQIHAMVRVRIRAVFADDAYPLYCGFADAWQETAVDYSAGYSEWVLSATDSFKILAARNLAAAAPVGANEPTGARISRVLDLVGWYTGIGPGARMIAAGDSLMQAYVGADTALNLLQVATDSEAGQLYVDGSGAVVFRNRRALVTGARSATSQATFGDLPGGAELPCAMVARADDDTTIGNDIQATIAGGSNMQEAQDGASQAMYLFARTYSRSDLMLISDPEALNWAGYVLYIAKSGEDRFDSVTVDPAAQPADLWPQVLGRDMGDRVTVTKRPPPSLTTPVTRDCFITGVTHTFDAATSAWSTQWTLADAAKYGSFLTLNNATLGQLDGNALAW